MSLKEKYSSVLDLGQKLKVAGGDVVEENGKLQIKGKVNSEVEKNQLWDEIKSVAGGSMPSDLVADIEVDANVPSAYPKHTVAAGESLSKIAEQYLGDKMAYNKIFALNSDKLDDPDKVEVGQVLRIPVA